MRSTPALHERDSDPDGFSWVAGDDAANSAYSFLRFDSAGNPVLFVANFTPIVRHDYRLGVPRSGAWVETLNSDNLRYGGSGVLNEGDLMTEPVASHGFDNSIRITVPPLTGVFIQPA